MQLSKIAVSKLAAVSSENIENKLSLLASTLLAADLVSHMSLEMAISRSEARLLCCCELVRYDETPMRVSHKQQLRELFPDPPDSKLGSSSTAPQDMPATSKQRPYSHTLRSTPTASKIFAVEQRFLMVLELGEDAATSDIPMKYVALSGQDLTALRVLNRGSGECQHHCLRESSPISRWANAFALKVRAATTDQAGANYAAEEGFSAHRQQDGWCSLHLPCQLHIVARCFSKSFDLAHLDISGMVNLSLCLGVGGQMQAFRKALVQVIQERLVIVRGSPPPEAREFRSHMLDVFCSKGRNLAIRRFLLEHYATGDWRKVDTFEVYMAPVIEIDEAVVTANVCKAMALALTGSLFRTYPRHRWVGADQTLDQIGLAECVHGLASAAFRKMHVLSGDHKGRTSTAAQRPDSSLPTSMGGATSSMHVGAAPSGVPAPPAAQPLPPPDEEGPEETAADVPDDYRDEESVGYSAANAAALKKAGTWLESSPLHRLLTMRLCMKPLTDLLDAHLVRASDAWETEQRAAAAATDENTSVGRKCRVLEYLQLVSEGQFFQELSQLLHKDRWRHIDVAHHHLEFQSWVFKLISRMGALVHELMVLPTQRYPMQLFSIVLDPQAGASKVQAAQACELDDFSSGFIKTFQNEGVDSEAALAVLQAVALCIPTDTVGIEWGHGRVSRLIKAQSQQTQSPSMGFVNGQFVCMKQRQRFSQSLDAKVAAFSQDLAGRRRGQPSGSKASAEQVAKRRGGGGSWRTFVSKRARGQHGKADFKALAAEYQELQETGGPDLAEVQQVGVLATRRHAQTGEGSFGQPTRQMRRRRQRQLVETGEDAPGLSFTSQLHATSGQPVTVSANQEMGPLLSAVRKRAADLQASKRKAREDVMTTLQSFQEEYQAPALETLLLHLPELVGFLPALQLVPVNGMCMWETIFQNEEAATAVATWALRNSRSSKLKRALDEKWAASNRMVFHDDVAALPKRRGSRHALCLQYGGCVHKGKGRLAFLLRNAFTRQLKVSLPRTDPLLKKDLVSGCICVELRREQRLAKRASWAELVEEELLAEQGDEQGLTDFDFGACEVLHLHIALQYLKPYRPTFQRLEYLGHEAPIGSDFVRQATFLESLRSGGSWIQIPLGVPPSSESWRQGPQCQSYPQQSALCSP